MKTFTTHLRAINPDTQSLETFAGPYIIARSWDEAEEYIYSHELGYLVIDGELQHELKEDNLAKVLAGTGLN